MLIIIGVSEGSFSNIKFQIRYQPIEAIMHSPLSYVQIIVWNEIMVCLQKL